MSDKIRGALFNVLGELDGLTVLDAFAGTGALGFEAISRGAQSVVAIESDRTAQQTIATNSTALGLDASLTLAKTTAEAWLQANPGSSFDIVLCDPPYDNMQPVLLAQLASRALPEGLLVISAPGDAAPYAFNGFTLLRQRSYGDAQLLFYRRQ